MKSVYQNIRTMNFRWLVLATLFAIMACSKNDSPETFVIEYGFVNPPENSEGSIRLPRGEGVVTDLYVKPKDGIIYQDTPEYSFNVYFDFKSEEEPEDDFEMYLLINGKKVVSKRKSDIFYTGEFYYANIQYNIHK